MGVCIVSILLSNGNWNAPKCGGNNEGEVCHPNPWILYYLYMFIWPWMFCVSFDTFALVVSFINTLSKPTPMIIGIFEVHNITSASVANQVKGLLDSFGLLDKVFAYVKD